MVGYYRIPCSDPEEQRLRDAWYDAADERSRQRAGDALGKYIWNRVERQVDVDRAKHPKAKRNLPVPTTGASGGRYLP